LKALKTIGEQRTRFFFCPGRADKLVPGWFQDREDSNGHMADVVGPCIGVMLDTDAPLRHVRLETALRNLPNCLPLRVDR